VKSADAWALASGGPKGSLGGDFGAREGSEAAASKERMKERRPRLDGAELLKRTLDFDVLAYVRCTGRLKGTPFKVL
jgi:hypothetical protein